MKRQTLITQHHIVGARNGDNEGHARRGKQDQQRIHVVLVGLGMIGVTDVDAHGQAKQLATEMVFQPGANDLLTVVEVFGSNESDDGVDQEGFQVTGHRVGPGLQGLLIDWFTAGTQVSTRTQRGTLPRFQIHDVVTDGPSA
ncbi:Uncharacterised protein [Mycobacteroides abscessus subsp. abscessus]|nr:Uncharacterised protein [Mycobacteroides abscessus subsp. abscessus]